MSYSENTILVLERIEEILRKGKDENERYTIPEKHFIEKYFVDVDQKIHDRIFFDSGVSKPFKDFEHHKNVENICQLIETIVCDVSRDPVLSDFLKVLSEKHKIIQVQDIEKKTEELFQNHETVVLSLISDVSTFYGGFPPNNEESKKLDIICGKRIDEVRESKKENDNHGSSPNLVYLGEIRGSGVCRHRSILFKVCCDYLGIKCRILRGWIRFEGKDEPHMWNEVVIGRKTFKIDTMNFMEFVPEEMSKHYRNTGRPTRNPELRRLSIERIQQHYNDETRKSIGHGAFSTVFEMKNAEIVIDDSNPDDLVTERIDLAIKEVNITQIARESNREEERIEKYIRKEFENIDLLCHPNVVEIIGSFCKQNEFDENIVHVVMKKNSFSASLFLHNLQKGRLGDLSKENVLIEVLFLFQEIARGLRYIHSFGVIHFDIKLTNILVDWNYEKQQIEEVRISDFGSSKGKDYNYLLTTAPAVTRKFAAPEVKKLLKFLEDDVEPPQDIAKFSLKSDIYSFGFLISMFSEFFDDNMSKTVVEKCKVDDPQTRPSAKDLILFFGLNIVTLKRELLKGILPAIRNERILELRGEVEDILNGLKNTDKEFSKAVFGKFSTPNTLSKFSFASLGLHKSGKSSVLNVIVRKMLNIDNENARDIFPTENIPFTPCFWELSHPLDWIQLVMELNLPFVRQHLHENAYVLERKGVFDNPEDQFKRVVLEEDFSQQLIDLVLILRYDSSEYKPHFRIFLNHNLFKKVKFVDFPNEFDEREEFKSLLSYFKENCDLFLFVYNNLYLGKLTHHEKIMLKLFKEKPNQFFFVGNKCDKLIPKRRTKRKPNNEQQQIEVIKANSISEKLVDRLILKSKEKILKTLNSEDIFNQQIKENQILLTSCEESCSFFKESLSFLSDEKRIIQNYDYDQCSIRTFVNPLLLEIRKTIKYHVKTLYKINILKRDLQLLEDDLFNKNLKERIRYQLKEIIERITGFLENIQKKKIIQKTVFQDNGEYKKTINTPKLKNDVTLQGKKSLEYIGSKLLHEIIKSIKKDRLCDFDSDDYNSKFLEIVSKDLQLCLKKNVDSYKGSYFFTPNFFDEKWKKTNFDQLFNEFLSVIKPVNVEKIVNEIIQIKVLQKKAEINLFTSKNGILSRYKSIEYYMKLIEFESSLYYINSGVNHKYFISDQFEVNFENEIMKFSFYSDEMDSFFECKRLIDNNNNFMARIDGKNNHTFHFQFQREFHFLSKLSHPGIIKVFSLFKKKIKKKEKNIMIVEKCPKNDLYSLFPCSKPLKWRLNILIQICEIMKYLHSKNFILRFLHPSCFFYDSNMSKKEKIKLVCIQSCCNSGLWDRNYIISNTFCDPFFFKEFNEELSFSPIFHSFGIDVYSFGILMAQLFQNINSYEVDNLKTEKIRKQSFENLKKRISKNPKFSVLKELTEKYPNEENITKEYYSLARECTFIDPTKRPNFIQISKELKKMMKILDPSFFKKKKEKKIEEEEENEGEDD